MARRRYAVWMMLGLRLWLVDSGVAAQTIAPKALNPHAVVLQNPYSCLFDWRGQNVAPLPHAPPDTYERFTWRDLEPEKDKYDFTALDAAINDADNAGQKFAFRVRALLDSGISVPDYMQPYGGMAGEMFVPNWNNAYFLTRYEKLFEALGNAYDGDPRVSFLDIGTYGKWGEWNLSTGTIATAATKRKLVDMVVNHFPNTRLVMMTDDEYALFYALGLSPRIGWRRDSLGWGHFRDTPYAKWGSDTEKWRMFVTRYRTAPVVAEFANFDDSESTKNWADYFTRALAHVAELHVATVGNGNIGKAWEDMDAMHQAQLLDLARIVGIRPRLVRVKFMNTDDGLEIKSTWRNDGTVPAYEAYEVRWSLRDADTGAEVWSGDSALNMETLYPAPDPDTRISDLFPAAEAPPPGEYDLWVTAVDPGGLRAPLAMDIQGETDGAYAVGSVVVDSAAASAGDGGEEDASAGDGGTDGGSADGDTSPEPHGHHHSGCSMTQAPVSSAWLAPLLGATALLWRRRRLRVPR